MQEAKATGGDDNMGASNNSNNNYEALNVEKNGHRSRRRRRIAVCAAVAVVILILFFVGLILALTVFKQKDPITEIVSATVDGVSPRVTIPTLRLLLNVTLDLRIRVTNRNYASFRHDTGHSVLTYRSRRIGEAEIFPGTVPARGSAVVPCRLTLEVDELGSDMAGLVQDVVAGEIAMETSTRIPGRVTFLGFIKKHAVAYSDCRFTIGVSDMKVRSQECETKTKL